jgi:DNA-binding response OmpR family regulator
VTKHTLLLIDGDARSLRVLEVSLRNSGFVVTTAETVADAVERLASRLPDLIISETRFEDGNGFDLRRRLSERDDWRDIPFVFLTAENAIEYKIRGLELGVDDYLTKPIYVKEIVARIHILLQKKERTRIEERKDLRTRFVGRISDMPVVDVIQTIEISRKSGVISFVGERQQQAAIYFRDGKVIDAEAGTLLAEDAVYRLLTWVDGDFEVVFRMIRRREVIASSSQALLMEGMRRLDEWTLLLEQLPSHASKFEVDTDELATRLGGLPDAYNRVLRLIDGKRSLMELVESCDLGDLECLQVVVRLYFEGLLVDVATPEEQLASTRPRFSRTRPTSESPIRNRTPSPSGSPISSEVHGAESIVSPSAPEPDLAGTNERSERDQSNELATARASGLNEPMLAEYEPSPLLGGYRKSSLRLIDAAVAAAEAVDGASSDGPPAWLKALGAEAGIGRIALVKAGRGKSDPELPALSDAINAAEPADDSQRIDNVASTTQPTVEAVPVSASDIVGEIASPSRVNATPDDLQPLEIGARQEIDVSAISDLLPTSDERPNSTIDRSLEQSQVSGEVPRPEVTLTRMISSLGRETAQVAGEVSGNQFGKSQEGSARQMVTILPRRSTREIQVFVSSTEIAAPKPDVLAREELPATLTPAISNSALEPSPATVASSDSAKPARTPRPSLQIPITGGTTRQPPSRNGLFAVMAALAISAAVYATCRNPQTDTRTVRSTWDAVPEKHSAAQQPTMAVPDAAEVPVPVEPVRSTVDDAAPVDASNLTTSVATPKIYKEALVKATEALREGDAQTALKRATESINDRPTARGYVVKADALRRLGKNDEAIAAADNATRMAADFAPAWEMKGRVLWSAKLTSQATVAFKRFLALEPKGKRADDVRALLGE